MCPRKSLQTRHAILQAAYHLVQTEGIAHLTLDAVAKNAGVSKGGLLYHFPSKEALIKGMIDYVLSQFENELNKEVAEMGERPGKWTRAFVRATFKEIEEGSPMSLGIFTAVATHPQLLEPIQSYYRKWQQRIEDDGLDPALASLIRFAADGIWLAHFINLAPPNPEQRKQILERLIHLIEEETS
ncbi:TetR/AcrR family transcriptional regulator [Thermoflavimicrobium dichotomicum]|uniref:DNA-binding transcriptional regulator, AcrR family n=1 Tax=Thermoflavimicrobium dichotomicum TaxID=46223 RepID=A0A1I3UR18_9BACL|nr:TetR/AcrR family transcriptional regulator [Thermoflavimicrobium dichotomicum]SFJ85834.1 DNA-binding transcriptional regulator, AcrR family [Thermoflavimicrobium dichotomicum]